MYVYDQRGSKHRRGIVTERTKFNNSDKYCKFIIYNYYLAVTHFVSVRTERKRNF